MRIGPQAPATPAGKRKECTLMRMGDPSAPPQTPLAVYQVRQKHAKALKTLHLLRSKGSPILTNIINAVYLHRIFTVFI